MTTGVSIFFAGVTGAALTTGVSTFLTGAVSTWCTGTGAAFGVSLTKTGALAGIDLTYYLIGLETI